MEKLKWPGGGHKFTCHRCGFWYSSLKIRREWTGLYVCPSCHEPRHPQTLIKVHGEKAFPDIVSKDATATFVSYCDISTRSAYTDLGTTDCMQVDNSTYSYTMLNDLNGNGHT